ncbi:hypothetical protein EFA46_007585 [Halarchaeum sp. CBA1220]|uniref:hypothetical protein n=1 Tax=Halarchaeum sp. CBA1220 TaxID=1853682 RepID=UPI0011CD8395|nr:hypothetical protein [Halarchaeum sp. CBA1220]QLC34070.1 hypothetical protein EFA46_007585 [Halarchaeum sp. CBA1220]
MSDVNLADFIEANSELFVVLGVFSALAIYISNISSAITQSPNVGVRVGFVGSLLLALLTLLQIYRRLLNRIGSIREVIEAHAEANNIDLVLFTTSMSAIVPSLALPILSRETAIYYILEILFVFVLIPLFAGVIYNIIDRAPDAGRWFSAEIAITSVGVLWISLKLREYLNNHPDFSDPALFSLNNLFPALGGALYWVLNFVIMSSLMGVFFGITDTIGEIQEEYGSKESDDNESG